MATGTASFSGEVYSFKISYEYTNTSFKFTKIVVTGTSQAPYWTNWEQTPSLYIYALKGSSPIPKSSQSGSDNLGAGEAKDYITDRNGKYQLVYNGNDASTFLPSTSGGTKTWSSDNFDDIKLSLSGSSVTITVGAFIANTTGTLNDVVYGSDTFTLTLYTAPKNDYTLSCDKVDDITVDTLKVTHSWTKGSVAVSDYTVNKIVVDRYNYETEKWETSYRSSSGISNGGSVTFGSSNKLAHNSYYRIIGTISDGTTSRTETIYRWTKPSINSNGLTVSLVTGKEHDEITVTVKASVSTPYDQFNFSKDGGTTWTGWTDRAKSATHIFTNLNEHTKYQIAFKMRNPHSEGGTYNTTYYAGGIDTPTIITKSITTWYDPMSSLHLTLDEQGYWKLKIRSNVIYNGTIEKSSYIIYEKGTTNPGWTLTESVSKTFAMGTNIGGESNNLKYNTEYTCRVKLEDEYGRMAEATATFKTLDERPLYIDNQLREVKLIKPDSSVHYITPNLLSVIKSDGIIVNMDDIINPDRVK